MNFIDAESPTCIISFSISRILMSSASLSEESLARVCGEDGKSLFPWLLVLSDTLGIERKDVRAFFKDPTRANVYQQVRRVPIISSRCPVIQVFWWHSLPVTCNYTVVREWMNFSIELPVLQFERRFRARNLSFLIPLAASGRKIQVGVAMLFFWPWIFYRFCKG